MPSSHWISRTGQPSFSPYAAIAWENLADITFRTKPNISSRRLGDCDYQSSEQKMIYAYESHGGILTDVYVKEHLRTLRKSFALRKEELEGIAELDEWEIVVTFIAHELALQNYEDGMRLELEGACVVFLFKTFEILKTEWLSDEPNYDYLDQLIIGPLQKKHTPTEVRRVLLTLKG